MHRKLDGIHYVGEILPIQFSLVPDNHLHFQVKSWNCVPWYLVSISEISSQPTQHQDWPTANQDLVSCYETRTSISKLSFACKCLTLEIFIINPKTKQFFPSLLAINNNHAKCRFLFILVINMLLKCRWAILFVSLVNGVIVVTCR